MKAIGIDLGTTNSLVAVVENGRARTLMDDAGDSILPSAVRYEAGGEIVVGKEAREHAALYPERTMLSVKRLIGRTKAEAETSGLHDYTLEQDGSALRITVGNDSKVTPIEVSAEILKTLKARASAQLGGEVSKAVITVPAYFDDTQRQATRNAGRLAGLEVMRLVNEPTAAALAYGLDKQRQGRFAVFDLGGGTFDISILDLVEGVFEVLSTGGDTQLGGDDFDAIVATWLLADAGITDTASAAQRRAAVITAEAAKRSLTDTFQAELRLSVAEDVEHVVQLSRDEYEGLIRPTLNRVISPCKRALSDAGIRPDQLDGVVLVGGSTRSPFVQRFVADFFEQKPLCDIDPDEVVALGAASQADLLSVDSELRLLDGGDVLLLDVTPLSVGLETMGGLAEKVIPRCSQIPASRSQEFTTYQDGQTAMDIHVVQGERELVADCRSLARFQLVGIPAGPAGQARVRVTFQIDADGILKVGAKDLTSGVEQSVNVEPTHGLTDAEVEEMLQASLDFAEDDVNARFLRTAQVESERALTAINFALDGDSDLLTEDENTVIKAVIADLKEANAGTDHRQIQDLTELLDRVSSGFAHRRMERALAQGLKDTRITDLADELEVNEVADEKKE
jgi:molecular chaperone HscA